MSNAPKVSIIMPTLNAAGVLDNCLESIRKQDYPADRLEIVIADGGSTDETRAIAERFGASVVENPLRGYDTGKCAAMAAASGDYFVYIDADNEIARTDFLTKSISAMERYPEALGFESYYPPSPKMNSFTAYISHLLHISDPIAWLMSVKPKLVKRDGDTEIWTFPSPEKMGYPMGANGFIFRREDVAHLGAGDKFEDCSVALDLASRGRSTWLRIRGQGVHHYVVSGMAEFILKRRRQTFHFLSLRGTKQKSWTEMGTDASPLMACIYCASVIGPTYHTILGIIKSGDLRWLWHPVTSLASVLGVTWGTLTYYLGKTSGDREAQLQPKQKLK